MPDPKSKIARMVQPESLRSDEYQPWSRGRGVDADPKLAVPERLDKPDVMELILRYQPDILKRTPDPTPWWSLATPGDPEYARRLMERGLDPNRPNWLGITLLHRCAAKGDIGLADVCLEFGADINAIETDSSSTPLACAIRADKKEMVEWLLKKGADPKVPSDELWAVPAAWAQRRGRPDIAQLLRKMES